ncbi:MAG: hypothetical protein A2V88_02385 [Elusimicrobia bacterium RBG_16_66_12]|nr:MAG: hypothetical protein A2V88_02385 [Elusimicrobia bacterium RBG_16_66_12]
MKALALLLLAAAAASAHDRGLSRLFDGSPSGEKPRFSAPRPEAPRSSDAPARRVTEVPRDLSDAKSRVGIDAQLAKLGASDKARFAFGVIGDAERGRFAWERVFSPGRRAFEEQLASLQGASPDFIFQLGDFVSEGEVDEYRGHLAVLDKSARLPLLRCVGNHDRSRPNGDADKALYDAVFGPRDYFFDRGGWRFVSLDSSDRKVTSAQLAWLAKALDTPKRKVVFTHVPPAYIKSITPLAEVGELEQWSTRAKEAAAQKGALGDFFTNYFEDGSAEFESLVSSRGVAAVYMGHIHAFWAADFKGVRYVISGGGGSPLYPLPPGYPKKRFAHFLSVEASPTGLVETVHPYKGAPFVLPPVKP